MNVHIIPATVKNGDEEIAPPEQPVKPGGADPKAG